MRIASAVIPLFLLITAATACTNARQAGPRAPWSYQVGLGPEAEILNITARFPPETEPRLTLPEAAARFVYDLEVRDGAVWRPATSDGALWELPLDEPGPAFEVRYRFALARAARSLGSSDLAWAQGDAIQSPPSTWLLRPDIDDDEPSHPIRMEVETAPGVDFVSGLDRDADGAYTFESSELWQLVYTAMGRLRRRQIDLGETLIDVAFMPGPLSVSDDDVLEAIRRSALALKSFYGRFPPESVLILVRPIPYGQGLASAQGFGGAGVYFPIARDIGRQKLLDDWVLTHELTHLAFPCVDAKHHWIEEGLATYVEPLARARHGTFPIEQYWKELYEGLFEGQPGHRERGGLDANPSWGRTYWGGALFCLLADLEIRRRTDNRLCLDDALKAIVAEGGLIKEFWNFDRVLAVADQAIGSPVLRPLYERYGRRSERVNIDALFRELGVNLRGGGVRYDDSAPLARYREALLPRARPR